MKEKREKEIENLLSIIPINFPIMDIFHLCDDCDGLCEALNKLCLSLGYHYDLAIVSDEYYHHLEKNSDLHPKKFNFKKQRYNIQSRVYDFVFVSIDLEAIENPALFYKKLYAINKNAGKVFFILPKEANIRALEDTLILHNYVATNPIEDIFEDYQILSAQKMHGWDN